MKCDGRIVKEDISIDVIIKDIINNTYLEGCGAISIFIGYVKGLIGSAKVYELAYEAYEPYASKKLKEIACETANKYSIPYILILHKTGSLKPGEISIYIISAAVTRHDAIEAVKEALERVKKEVPIFKLEKRNDGEYWIVGDGKRVPRSKLLSDY
ncbi:MAG: molybdenum cofactor biosynthesis protein MoaE [Thermoprotei archaeon]|nr:MAG: molybdenum cofactor biosynthesis protein MoaE [Thermoprotei archaeon]